MVGGLQNLTHVRGVILRNWVSLELGIRTNAIDLVINAQLDLERREDSENPNDHFPSLLPDAVMPAARDAIATYNRWIFAYAPMVD